MGEVYKRADGLEARVVDRLAELIGREVVVEGTFPIPVGQQYAFSPMRGRLTGVFHDGIEILSDGETEPAVCPLATVRSVYAISKIARPSSKLSV